jgi:hypothetical protein
VATAAENRLNYPVQCTRRALAKFAPGQPFSIAAGRRYDGEQRCGMGPQSELALEPGPQKIWHSQPRWLLRVNPASEHHKAPIRNRCVAANDVAVPSNRIRVGNEDPADPGACTKHRLSIARLIAQRDDKTLLNKKIGDSLLDVRRARRALIGAYNQFRPEREQKR